MTLIELRVGDAVRHLTDPHGRSFGTVIREADHNALVRVRWSGVGEPDDFEETVHRDEIRLWEPKR